MGAFEAHQLRPHVARAAELLLRYNWKSWFWGDSAGCDGLLDAAEWLREPKYQAFVYGMMKTWAARRDPARAWEYTAPGGALMRLYNRTSDPALLRLAREHADYLAAFSQTEHGAYLRFTNTRFDFPPEIPGRAPDTPTGSRFHDGGPCVFVDTMHFDAPFFARLYQATGDDRYRGLALTCIQSGIRLLFDEARHLFHHFWSERLRARNGVLWGRGQGWAMLGIIETLESLPVDDPAAEGLLQVFREHSAALERTQDSSGHWHTVITDRDSYLEPSVAAFVVHGFSRGLRRGWLPESLRPVLDRAFMALLGSVGEDGLLRGVSYETHPSLHAEHYRTMPRGAMVPWGQGPLLSAIASYAALNGL